MTQRHAIARPRDSSRDCIYSRYPKAKSNRNLLRGPTGTVRSMSLSSEANAQRRMIAAGILLVLLTAVISGVSTFVNFWAVQGFNSDAFITVRNPAVTALLLPLALLARRDVRTRLRKRDWARLVTIGLLGGAIPFVLFFRGLQMAGTAGAATATFGYRTLFIMASVFAFVFLRERIPMRILLAAGLLLAGNALLLSLTAPVWSDGTLLVLAATALWAGEYTLSKRTLRDLPSSTVALGRMGFGAVFLVAYIGISGQLGAISAFNGEQLGWVGISALLLIGFVMTWYFGLRHVDVSVATSVLVVAFPITLLLGLVAGRPSLGLMEAAGVVTIVFGVVLVIGLGSLRELWVSLDRIVRSEEH